MQRGTLLRSSAAQILAVAGIGLSTAPLAAQSYTNSAIFSTTGQSVWASGPAFVFDTGQKFLGTSWDLGKTFGGVDETCVFGVCAKFGAQIGAQTTGKIGVDYNLSVNSGSFDLLYPALASVTVPTAVPTHSVGNHYAPDPLTVGTGFQGVSSLAAGGSTKTATLQVTGPTLQAGLALEAHASAFAGAEVCVGVCYGPAFSPPPLDKDLPIVSVNQGNSGTLTVLGQTVSANQNVSALGGLINASIKLPNLDGSSAATPGGFSGGVLTSTKRDGIAAVNANVAQIAANAVGFPIPLSGNLGPFGYNLLQSNAGIALDVQQTLSFTPAARGRFLFSSPITPIINGVAQGPTTDVAFSQGDDVTFSVGDLSGVGFQTFVDLYGTVKDTLSLVVNGDINVQALGLNIAGLTVGPLINEGLAKATIGTIKLFENAFQASIGSTVGSMVNLKVGCGSSFGGGEFAFTRICSSSQFVDVGDLPLPGGTFLDIIDTEDCGTYEVGYISSSPSCTRHFSNFSGPYTYGPDGKVYLSGDPLGFEFSAADPSATDDDAIAWLSSLGYTPGLPSFGIPEGAPLSAFATPEPGRWMMMGLGFAGLIALRIGRRRGAAPNAQAVG